MNAKEETEVEKINRLRRLWYEENKEKINSTRKKYYHKNKDKLVQQSKQWRNNNKELKAQKAKEYNLKNKEKLAENKRRYYQENKEKLVKQNTANTKRKRQESSIHKLKDSLRRRILLALKANNFVKTQNTEKILGTDMITVKNHIESQFKDGMDWSNHGFRGWHLDHIIPLASAKTKEEMYNLCHYTNLQPLWAFENFSKGCRIA